MNLTDAMPICTEVDRQMPVPPSRRRASENTIDPLTAPLDQFRQHERWDRGYHR